MGSKDSFSSKRRIQEWLDGAYDSRTKEEIRRLQQEDPVALEDAFSGDLHFGTGGMRGLMGVGTNRLNVYTIRSATQGLCTYLLSLPHERPLRVFIGYDMRIHSRLFAEQAASVLAANGVEAWITKEICPTPLTSFGCRFYRCHAAIMITASHNPPQYNGYKVYWSDGAQIVAPHDGRIMEEVARIEKLDEVHVASLEDPLIYWVGDDLDQAYFEHLDSLQLEKFSAPRLSIIYTNLHGTGIRLLPEALHRWGFQHVAVVKEQQVPDGRFPTTPSPNPEDPEALALGSKKLEKEQADLLLATDPDADRLALVVRHEKAIIPLSGNQIACLLLSYIGTLLKEQKKLPKNAAFVKTIVTTELFRKIAEELGTCFDVLTGFKYISDLIRNWEEHPNTYEFVFGAEESLGFLFGTFVRDKDAISSSCIAVCFAEQLKRHNQTLLDALYALYRKFGVHREAQATMRFAENQSSLEKMNAMMQQLRHKPLFSIADRAVIRYENYLERKCYDVSKKTTEPLSLPQSDVLRYWLEDGSKLVIRPSGTEPKIKIYAEVCQKPLSILEEQVKACDQEVKSLIEAFQSQVASLIELGT